MTDKATVSALEQAVEEIVSLRGRLTHLEPKAQAFDGIMQILGMIPETSRGYGVDVVWVLRERIAELQPKAVEVAAGEAA